MDPCFGNEAATKACLLQRKNRKHYECDADGHCTDILRESFLEDIASEVINKESDSKQELRAEKAAKVFQKSESRVAYVESKYSDIQEIFC